MEPQVSQGRTQNMLNDNMDDELEPDLGFAQQPQYNDFDDQFGNQDGGLPNELENNELNMDNFDGQINNYNDLGEFQDTDYANQPFDDELQNFDGALEQQ